MPALAHAACVVDKERQDAVAATQVADGGRRVCIAVVVVAAVLRVVAHAIARAAG